jgi:hypothetical protein
MRRESHRRRGLYRASSGAWGHRAVYVGAVVATAAVIAGFGAALVVYGPAGQSYRQSSATTSPAAPTGVVYGQAQEAFASGLNLTNASYGNESWNWTAGGPCNASGLLDPSNGSYIYYDTNSTANWFNVTSGNTTLICLNSVGETPSSGGYNGTLNATWYYNASGVPLIQNDWNDSSGMTLGATYASSLANITACNNFTTSLPAGLQWNDTHVVNDTSMDPVAECSTFYQMNNNTNITPSFGGFNNSTEWSPNQSGYALSDVVFEVPVIFTNTSVNGTYQVSVDIGGVTPVPQTFFVNSTTHGGSNGTLLFAFDMTAAWLYDTSLNYSGMPWNNTTFEQVYGAIGLVSAIVTECSGAGVCPGQSSALVASLLPTV